MDKIDKITLLQKLLEKRYPADIYDIAEKNSLFRLRVDKILNKLNKLEEELNHDYSKSSIILFNG